MKRDKMFNSIKVQIINYTNQSQIISFKIHKKTKLSKALIDIDIVSLYILFDFGLIIFAALKKNLIDI